MFKRAQVNQIEKPTELKKEIKRRPDLMPEFRKRGYNENMILLELGKLGLQPRETNALFKTAVNGMEFREVCQQMQLNEIEIQNIQNKGNLIGQMFPNYKENYLEIFK